MTGISGSHLFIVILVQLPVDVAKLSILGDY